MPLSRAQSNFLDRWKALGGTQAPGDRLVEASQDCVIWAANGPKGWEYLYVSDRQRWVVGGELTGLVRDVLPEDIYSIAEAQNAKVVSTGLAHKFGWPGTIRGAIGQWAERVVVPVAPPANSTSAIVSHYSWSNDVPQRINFCLNSLLENIRATAGSSEQRLLAVIQNGPSYQDISRCLNDLRMEVADENSARLSLIQLALHELTYSEEELR